MPPARGPYVGERLRTARAARGVSLRALARDLGVSASLISQIETGKSQPSVSTLYALTTALGISVEDVFASADLPTEVDGTGVDGTGVDGTGIDGTGVPSMIAVLAAARGQRVGPLIRPAQRQLLQLDSGVTWERLGQVPDSHVDFLLITYAPGGTSSSNGGLMRHRGAEYGFLHSGELSLTLGFDDVVLRPGDAISFESTTPHRYRNDGTEPAVGIWFVTEPA